MLSGSSGSRWTSFHGWSYFPSSSDLLTLYTAVRCISCEVPHRRSILPSRTRAPEPRNSQTIHIGIWQAPRHLSFGSRGDIDHGWGEVNRSGAGRFQRQLRLSELSQLAGDPRAGQNQHSVASRLGRPLRNRSRFELRPSAAPSGPSGRRGVLPVCVISLSPSSLIPLSSMSPRSPLVLSQISLRSPLLPRLPPWGAHYVTGCKRTARHINKLVSLPCTLIVPLISLCYPQYAPVRASFPVVE